MAERSLMRQVVVAHAFNPSTQEAEASRSLWVQGQPGLQSKFQNRLQSYTERPCLIKQNNKQRMTRRCVCVLWLREGAASFSRSFPHLIFWESVFHWTRSSLRQWDPRIVPVNTQNATVRGTNKLPPAFTWALEIWTQGLALQSRPSYPQPR